MSALLCALTKKWWGVKSAASVRKFRLIKHATAVLADACVEHCCVFSRDEDTCPFPPLPLQGAEGEKGENHAAVYLSVDQISKAGMCNNWGRSARPHFAVSDPLLRFLAPSPRPRGRPGHLSLSLSSFHWLRHRCARRHQTGVPLEEPGQGSRRRRRLGRGPAGLDRAARPLRRRTPASAPRQERRVHPRFRRPAHHHHCLQVCTTGPLDWGEGSRQPRGGAGRGGAGGVIDSRLAHPDSSSVFRERFCSRCLGGALLCTAVVGEGGGDS